MNWSTLIRFGIAYLPTIIFILIIVVGLLKGFIRGFRKTSIYLLHSIICASICLLLFFILVNDRNVDKFILSTVNGFLGSPTYIQDSMEVSTKCETFREIFIEYIPKKMDFTTGLSLILSDNGAQLSTLVDVAYRLVFGLVLFVLYLILRLFLFVGYNAFKCGKRYDRKRDDLYQIGDVDTPARKNRILGATLGGGIGIFKAVVTLSFIGTFFFIFAGGIGDRTRDEIEFKDSNINLITDAYSEIGTYGSQGIYKILNMVRDEKDVPYYLLATNILFKGNLDDPIRGVNSNVYLTDEIAAYVKFSRDTLSLFIKYDRDNIVAMINNGATVNVMDEIIKVFKIKEFQEEFKVLIQEFDSKTYFINLTLSLVDSITNNLDILEFSRDQANDALVPLRIMFEQEYLCPDIPSEHELIIQGIKKDLGSIRPSQLLTRNDFYNIYDILMNVIDNYYELTGENNSEAITNIIRNSTSNITSLSILSSSRKEEFDPVLKRLFEYYEYKYMGGISENVIKTIDEDKMNVSWVDEISSITDYVTCIMEIYDSAKEKAEGQDVDGIMIFNELFESKHKKDLDHLIISLSASKLLGNLLSASTIIDGITVSIHSMSAGSDFPVGISIGDKYDDNGIFVEYGELHYLLKSILLLSENEKARTAFLDILFNNSNMASGEDPMATITELLEGLIGDDGQTSILETLISSKIFSSIISNYLINFGSMSSFRLYIDDSIKMKDSEGNPLRIINSEEMHKLFDNAKFITYMLAETAVDGVSAELMDEVLFGEEYNIQDLIDSKIIEGSISDYLFNKYSSDTIIIPAYLKNNDDVLISKNGKTSELMKLVRALDVNDVNSLFNGSEDQTITDFIINLNKEDCDILFASDVLYYTISNHFAASTDGINGIEIIIPDSVKEENDNDITLINKKEIKTLIINIGQIVQTEEDGTIDNNKILSNLLNNSYLLDNLIINASVANFIINTYSEESAQTAFKIKISGKYSTLVPDGEPKESYSRKSPWYTEIKVLINGLNAILEYSDNYEEIILTEKIIKDIKLYNYKENGIGSSKLDIVYSSNILADTLSDVLDEKLSNKDAEGNDVIKAETKENCKVNGRYRKAEIAGLINMILLYGIDPNDMSDETIQNIRSDVQGSFTNLLSDDIYTRRVDDKDVAITVNINDKDVAITDDYYYFESKNSEKRRIDLLFYSSIIKDIFTDEFIGILGIEENEQKLITDDSGYLLKEEVVTAIKMLREYPKITNISDIHTDITEYIDSYAPIVAKKDEFMETHLLSLILYNMIKEATPKNVDELGEKPFTGIPEKAKLLYRGKTYNALTDNEIEAILLVVTTDNTGKSKFGITIDGGTIVSDGANEEQSYRGLDEKDIAILSNSYLISNFIYNNFKDKAIVNKELYSVLDVNNEIEGIEIRYFELDELACLLRFSNKYGRINEITENELSFVLPDESEQSGNELPDGVVNINDCLGSKILTSILFDSIIEIYNGTNSMPTKLTKFSPAQKKIEVVAFVDVMKAYEIKSLADCFSTENGLTSQFITNNFELRRDNISPKLDIIYNSYIASNMLSNTVLLVEQMPPYYSEDVYMNKNVYISNEKRFKKNEMEAIVNVQVSERISTNISNYSVKMLGSIIYRHWITINSENSISTLNDLSFMRYGETRVLTREAIETYNN